MYSLFTFQIDKDATCSSSMPKREDATNQENAASAATVKSLPKIRNSALSQKSLVAEYMALDPVIQDAFEERAAILQYEAGLSREEAERRAFIQVMEAFRDI